MNSLNFKISIEEGLIYLTWLYSVHFLGALPDDLYSLLSIILIISPSVILYFVSRTFRYDKIKLKINLPFLFSLFILFILINYNGNNLFNDELSYAQNSYKLVTGISIYLYELIPVFSEFKMLVVYRTISLVLIIIPIYLLFFTKNSNKLLISLLVLILARFVLTFILKGHVGVHPPMHGFISSFFTTLFGLNDFNFKLIQTLPLILLIYYFIVKFKIDYFFSIVLIVIISTNPFLGYYNFIIEQSNYTPIFVSLILLLCYIKKINLKYISLIIGISLLFRSTSICLIAIPFLYNYFNKKKFDKSFFKNLIPLLIGFPTFFKSLVFGTPSTQKFSELNLIDIFNKFSELDIILNLYNVMGYLLIFPLILIFVLFYLKRWDILMMLFSVSVFYIFLHLLADSPKYSSKYYYELIGHFFILFYFTIIIFVKKFPIKYSRYISIIIITIFLKMNFNYKEFINKKHIFLNFDSSVKNLTDYHKNFNPILDLDNELNYLLSILKDDLNNTIVFNTSYHGNFPYVLLNLSKLEYDKIFNLSEKYNKINNFTKIDIDIDAINELNNDIKYLVLTDTLDKLNNSEITELLSRGWSIHLQKSLNKNDFGWLILKNNNFKNS
jgi:hypothetical protein